MAPGKHPARIVQHISSGSTCGNGDILVDENGNRWRLIEEVEKSILTSGTAVAVVRTIRDGKVY